MPKKAEAKNKQTAKERNIAKQAAKERAKQAEEKREEFKEAMKASRELLTTKAFEHEETMKNIKNEPRIEVLAKMNLDELKALARHYTQETSHNFQLRINITKNELIKKLIEFESSIDSNPHLKYGEEAGKKNRKLRTLKGGKRKRRRKHTRKHR